mgnify:CR=1 FL=1
MAWREAAAGSAAGVIGTAVGYPFDVVKTRLQAQPERFNAGMLRAFRTIAREEGAAAFFRGFVPPLCALITQPSPDAERLVPSLWLSCASTEVASAIALSSEWTGTAAAATAAALLPTDENPPEGQGSNQ